MPIYTPSQKDLDRSYLFEPAWYRVRIVSVGEKASRDGGSTNYPIEAQVICQADNGSTVDAEGKSVEGKSIEWNFNSKAMGFTVGFLKGLGVEVEAGKRYELKMAEGKTIDVFIERGTYNNNPKNEVNHKYRKSAE